MDGAGIYMYSNNSDTRIERGLFVDNVAAQGKKEHAMGKRLLWVVDCVYVWF
jgi:hypothetical protein